MINFLNFIVEMKLNYLLYCFLLRYGQYTPIIKYKWDLKSNYENYNSFNFWYKINLKKFRLTRLIEHNKLNKNNKNINFISVFWTRKILKYIDWIKIFFTWEYVGKDRFSEYDDYCLNDVDLSIWFREYENVDNYIRFPLWILYLFNAEKTSLSDINETIEFLEKTKYNYIKREKFCSLISSHDDIENTRTKTFDIVSQYWKVDCPWKLLHNIDANIPKYQDKIDFLWNYKYNICPENKEDIWYVTEKLIDSWKAWCIPIYRWLFWELEKKVFNEDCIMWLDDLKFSKEKEKAFVNGNIFKKWSSEYIYSIIYNLKNKLISIFK